MNDSYLSTPESRDFSQTDESAAGLSDVARNVDSYPPAAHDELRNRSSGTPNAEDAPNAARFSSFRSKYESRTRGAPSSTSQPSTASNQLSFRARQALRAKMANDATLSSPESQETKVQNSMAAALTHDAKLSCETSTGNFSSDSEST